MGEGVACVKMGENTQENVVMGLLEHKE